MIKQKLLTPAELVILSLLAKGFMYKADGRNAKSKYQYHKKAL